MSLFWESATQYLRVLGFDKVHYITTLVGLLKWFLYNQSLVVVVVIAVVVAVVVLLHALFIVISSVSQLQVLCINKAYLLLQYILQCCVLAFKKVLCNQNIFLLINRNASLTAFLEYFFLFLYHITPSLNDLPLSG